ncbi:MAG TPA: hypothetical protein VKB75_11575 [Jatrophihabitans sp.]|nr:hypothetical protein [Jatrophihabitans sp.]
MSRTFHLIAIGCCAASLVAVPVTAASVPAPRPLAQAQAGALPSCRAPFPFHPAEFPRRPAAGTRWLSLVPGTAFSLTGLAEGDDGKLHRHTIVSVVSRVTKRLDGVTTRIVFERDYQVGRLAESELAFEAADRSGNVWNVGEYPEEYENGHLAGAPSTWIAGLAKARAGIGMLAQPRLGTTAYSQGSAPRVGFHDCAKVAGTGRRVCIPRRCYQGVLIIREWAPNDPGGGVQLKYYAPHVGAIKVGQVGSGSSAEELHLTRMRHLTRAELNRIDAAVLRQDRRGYRVSPHLYARTARARVCHDD